MRYDGRNVCQVCITRCEFHYSRLTQFSAGAIVDVSQAPSTSLMQGSLCSTQHTHAKYN